MCVRRTLSIWCAIAVCLIKESVSYCQPFNKTSGLPKLCGYAATANFTHDAHFQGSVKSLKRVSLHMSKCSKYASLIACSIYAPRCEPSIEGPYLPCKTVCDEFERDCRAKISELGMEWIIGMCQLLPTKDDPNTNRGYLGRCFEPKGFVSQTKAKPLKCHNLIVPICQHIGYKKTVLTQKKQKSYITWATNKINSHYSDNLSCSLPRKRFFCMENFPPCVEEKHIGFYCRPKCQEFFQRNCTSPFSFTSNMCMELPKGTAKNDLCVQNQWPRAENWPQVRNPKPTPTVASRTPNKKGEVSPPETLKPSSPGSNKPPVINKHSGSKGKAKVAPIVGGVLAGVCVIALALGIAYLIYRNQKKTSKFPYVYDREILYNDENIEIS